MSSNNVLKHLLSLLISIISLLITSIVFLISKIFKGKDSKISDSEQNKHDSKVSYTVTSELIKHELKPEDFDPSKADILLKEATALKKENRYDEACEKLREAYSVGENLSVKQLLRLPMYLQLAGKNDEGWQELNKLREKYFDKFSQVDIEAQSTVFLKKEKRYKDAAIHSAITLLKEIIRDRETLRSFGTTPTVENRLKYSLTRDGINNSVSELLKKAKLEKYTEEITDKLYELIHSNNFDDIADRKVIKIFSDTIP